MRELLLGHGASGTAASMRPWVEALARDGVAGLALDVPRGRPDRSIGAFRDALADHPDAAIGGQSFGGRMASLLAAEPDVTALVLMRYPQHAPGHSEELRSEQWERI